MQTSRIIALCVVAAIVYGVIHDQITARLCVEYFTVGHPPLFGTHDPTLLGLGWGIIATWWVGLILGIALAFAARFGRRPRRSVDSLVRPVVQLMLALGALAACAGALGWVLASAGAVFLLEPMASNVPREKHTAYLADLWAHSASYLFGIVGGLAVCLRVWESRRHLPVEPPEAI
jgi:hypothetical protein